MFPWKTVGMHAPSYSSNALCVRRMEDSPRIQPTDTALMTFRTTWYSSAPLRSSRCPSMGQWRTLGCSSCTNHPQHSVSTWLWPWWAGSPLYMVGRVPLIPLFLAGNSNLTIPHMFSKRKDSGFPYGCADSAAADGRRGSNVYEVNPWLWQFGRGKPCLGGLTVKETAERKKAAREEKFKRACQLETRRHRKLDKA
jgi:hypothetical protein